MTCIDKSSSKAVLTDITNIASAAQPFNTIIEYLMFNRSSNPSPSEPPQNFERPTTPLGVRGLEVEDLEADQDLASACSRIVSESWEGISEALQNAKGSLRPLASSSPRLQTTTPPVLPSMVQDRPKAPRRKPTRKPPTQPLPNPTPTPAKFRYHGHSNSALADYKYFWNSRCEDWIRYEAELEEASRTAYDGIQKVDPEKDRISAPASRCPRFRRNGRNEREKQADEAESTATGYQGKYVPDLTAPIYPRTGDLALLHHPGALETELFFVGFPLHKIHQIFFAFSMDQRFDHHQRAIGAGDRTPHQDGAVEDESVEGKGNEDTSFWSEDTLVEDEDLISTHSSNKKPNGKYQEIGVWEMDWATKWEVLVVLFKEHELERRGRSGGAEGPEGKHSEMLEPYRAALVDDTVMVGFFDEGEDDQFARTCSEADLFDILVC